MVIYYGFCKRLICKTFLNVGHYPEIKFQIEIQSTPELPDILQPLEREREVVGEVNDLYDHECWVVSHMEYNSFHFYPKY